PPSAWIMPPFCTRASIAPSLTATLSRPSPATSRVMAWPAASATVPRFAWIMPWLLTLAPSRATEPPSARIEPWLITRPSATPAKWCRPAAKSLSLMARLEATRPPTLTAALGPKRTPLGLTKNTRPLAVKLPRMLEASDPSTRLRAMALLPGCRNSTDSPLPRLDACQLIATFWLVWVIFRALAVPSMVALPTDTAPPVGRAQALNPVASRIDAARDLSAKMAPLVAFLLVQPEVFLPPLLANSETATKVPSVGFQID